ncbi:MAG: hypothetical protein LBL33_01990 [Tannerella sp.]|jgi:hypothetical protein|nr:hypothetical protein [Tannerella sp.]
MWLVYDQNNDPENKGEAPGPSLVKLNWPKYVTQKGEMVNWIDADNFCWYKTKNGINILPDLRPDDNPVIIISN